MATPAQIADWKRRASRLWDAERVTLKSQTFATAEAYQAALTANLSRPADVIQSDVLVEVLGSDEYADAALDSFYLGDPPPTHDGDRKGGVWRTAGHGSMARLARDAAPGVG